ncbi:tripartite tricarboxylate transporter substrate binding protein [Aquabacterium sp. J223]|uniref:Bug family tripartite tricarboxylate transporter substrate binding protein n=1 Tax=Aquabacterium sp. J223 TaxID=2898431 RepID=UPI0021AD68F1|nr:tripartite tricarboxylate transporter substrate binding protein [Aquabacterium sp. J223]UUX95235.1 tripartite tricarboxylate transporter substrate binding protein [Aquabacterium sp. J223]
MLTRRHLLAGAGATLAGPHLLAQPRFPSAPITLYCPWPAGGGADAQLRGLARIAGGLLGQPVLVENRPGAAGSFGAAALMKVRADGYTLSQSHNAVLRQPFIAPTPYDPVKDFTYLLGVSDNPFGIVVRADAPWRTVEDFIEHARRQPNTVSLAVPGKASPGHLVGDQIAAQRKIDWTVVPFKGTAESMQQLLGGHVTAAIESTGWVPHVDAGRLRLLAVVGRRRLRKYPQVPTLIESGIDASDHSPWGIVGPAGMEPTVVRTLHDAFKASMESPDFVQLLASLAQEPLYMSGEEYRRYVVEVLPQLKAIVDRYNLKATA